MKTTALTAAMLLGLGTIAFAQERQSQAADRQPATVTEQQVEHQAQMARQERKNDEDNRYNPVKQSTNNKKENDGLTTGRENASATKKSSTKPGEQ